MHWTYLSEIQMAKVNPTMGVLPQVAGVLGMRVSELVGEAEEDKQG